jgi:hypothetical protein
VRKFIPISYPASDGFPAPSGFAVVDVRELRKRVNLNLYFTVRQRGTGVRTQKGVKAPAVQADKYRK